MFLSWKKAAELRTFRPELEKAARAAIEELNQEGAFMSREDYQGELDRTVRRMGIHKGPMFLLEDLFPGNLLGSETTMGCSSPDMA